MNRIAAGLSVLLLGLTTTAQAMLVHPTVDSSFPSAISVSESNYPFIIDSDWGAEETCRNNPIDNTDPLGLDVSYSENLGVIPGGYVPYLSSDASLLSKDAWEHVSVGAANAFNLVNNAF